MNGNDFLVTSWYQNGSCAPSNLFAYSFVPFPSCATAKPSDQLDGTCKQVSGKQTPTNFNSELCAKKDYDFLGQLSKNLGGQTYILFQSFANDVKCSDPAKTTEFYALTFNKNLNLNLNVEDWSPNNRQLSRDESNINKIYLTRDGSVIKTFDAKHLLLLRDVGGPCKQAIPNPAVCKAGLVCIPPAVALPRAAGSCQLPAATTTTAAAAPATTTTARNINSGASASSVALGAIALFATLFA